MLVFLLQDHFYFIIHVFKNRVDFNNFVFHMIMDCIELEGIMTVV